MCIYKKTNYRKIYEKHYGPIPVEPNGRTYEVHHIDGNHNNNDPLNLTAITLLEHYNIHKEQGNTFACYMMSIQRLDKNPEEISRLAKLNVRKQLANGTHPFQTKPDGSNMALQMLDKGIHPWQKRPDGSSNASDRVANGTHPFMTRADGTSVTQNRINSPGYINPFSKRPDGSSVTSDLIAAGLFAGRARSGKLNSRYDSTLYPLRNKLTGKIIHITQYDFAIKYKVAKSNTNHMIKKNKSCKGWQLIKACN